MSDPTVIYGRDGCPWCYRDPDEQITIVDDTGRQVDETDVDTLCTAFHIRVAITAGMREAWDAAVDRLDAYVAEERANSPAVPPVFRACDTSSPSPSSRFCSWPR